MPDKTINGVPVEAIIRHHAHKPENLQWVSELKDHELAVVEPDPRWPEDFQMFKSRILAAFEPHRPGDDEDAAGRVDILAINHVGSTSVALLPAKAVIDIDLVLSSNSLASEPFYVPRLEAAGFQFMLRHPQWHEHRWFCAWEPMSCNLHVWGPGSPEVERHRLFRDWLREHDDDRELYGKVKKESAALSKENGETIGAYNRRKTAVLREILARVFAELQ